MKVVFDGVSVLLRAAALVLEGAATYPSQLIVSDWALLESYLGTLVGDFSIQQNNKGQAIRQTMQIVT
jgi:hypothetical protein